MIEYQPCIRRKVKRVSDRNVRWKKYEVPRRRDLYPCTPEFWLKSFGIIKNYD